MVEIRTAREEEKEEIKEFIDKIMKNEGIYEPHYGYADIEELESAYGDSNGEFYIAEENGRIIGTAGVFKINGSLSHLRRWNLDPAYRGKGIGKQLLDKTIEFSEQNGYLGLTGVSEHELRKAFKIYVRNGFKVFRSSESFNYIVKPLQDEEQLDQELKPFMRMNWDTEWKEGSWQIIQVLEPIKAK